MKPLVEITWEDSGSNAHWLGDEELSAFAVDAVICKTAGYLVRKDRDGVVIASSLASTGQVGGPWRIPRRVIRKMRRLR